MNNQTTKNTIIRTTYFAVLLALFVALLPTTAAYASNTGISVIGGDEVEAGAYPWAVALIENDKDDIFWAQYCGGTLIHPFWVLTAAHCTYSGGKAMVVSDIDVLAGQHELRGTNGERIAVEQIIRHPNYNRKNGDFDLALIKLATPSTQPVVKLAALGMVNIDESAALGTVIGWGRTETNIRVNHMKQVNVPLVADETCASAYTELGYTLTENMLCAGYAAGGKDACSGDSGGPLVVREVEGDKTSDWIQVGVVSWGKGCAQANAYGVYTHIALFQSWIDVQIALDGFSRASGTAVNPPVQGQGGAMSQVFLPVVSR